MRVTLNQDEIFEAVSDYLRDKLNLDKTASIEISFTAGRGPKGYTADVEITYEKSELASKFTAKTEDTDLPGLEITDAPLTTPYLGAAADAGAASAGKLFS
jgi:hypothetical protein